MKVAIIVISDPKAGEEALARVFNALAAAAEAEKSGHETEISFVGTGTRWPAELAKLIHPAHALYEKVRTLVVGASGACATVFGATEGLRSAGVQEKRDNPIPGTPGLLSLNRYVEADWKILLF